MLVVTRYRVDAAEAAAFQALAVTALEALTAQTGCTGGHLGRNVDDAALWTLTTTWQDVGSYRRALSTYPVKLHAVPVMYRAVDEPTAFEDLVTWTPSAGLVEHAPARAADADRAGPGR